MVLLLSTGRLVHTLSRHELTAQGKTQGYMVEVLMGITTLKTMGGGAAGIRALVQPVFRAAQHLSEAKCSFHIDQHNNNNTARERITMQLLESIRQHGWVMGVLLNVETPGFMIGLAGIGYELLRLAEPTRVPSVFILVPPFV